MSLAAHMLETYEDRKPPLHLNHPPQNYQRNATIPHPIAGYHQSNMQPQAGPSNYARSNNNGNNSLPPGGCGDWANHGMPWWMTFPPHIMQAMQGGRMTEWSEERVAQLQHRLQKKLGPEYVAQRTGPAGGGKLSYIEGWKVINLANDVFGFNGWSSSIISLTTDFMDVNEQGRCSVGITAHVRITLRDGAYHEDIGGGQAENIKGKGAALDKAKKEAVTDATKRALRNFGNVLGNCLYDKSFTANVAKMKVPPAVWKPEELERRPEFTEAGGVKPAPAPASVDPQPLVQPAAKPAVPTNCFVPDRMREHTPLRSIHDPILDVTAITMDENFDAEFMEGESFLNGVEESLMHAESVDRSTNQAPALVAAPPPQPQQPVYQHRHRPDPPQIQAANNNDSFRSAAGVPRAAAPVQDQVSASSSGSSGTVGESTSAPHGPQTRSKGGFQYPGKDRSVSVGSTVTGSNARALAIMEAEKAAEASRISHVSAPIANRAQTPGPLRTNVHYQKPFNPPIRAESPRIPSGGINEINARATTNYRANAQRLELDTGEDRDVGMGQGIHAGGTAYVGFASARGMKRVVSGEERYSNPSPTKQGVEHGYGIHMDGPRRALGEINFPVGEDDYGGVKRARAG